MEGLRFLRRLSSLKNFSLKMHPEVINLKDCNRSKSAKLAANDLKRGDIIAVPTDTIYGVACLVQVPTAVDKLYAIKGRHPEKPVAVCLAEISDLFKWGDITVSRDLLEDLLPGPVTLCFDRLPDLNPAFNPGAKLVGIRIPDNAFIREVCRHVNGTPVALTSANVSQARSCLEVSEFLDDLSTGLARVFDDGRLCKDQEDEARCRQGSTIIDLSHPGRYKVIRDGSALGETCFKLEKYGLFRG